MELDQLATKGPITMSAKTMKSTISPSFASSDMCSSPGKRPLVHCNHKLESARARVTRITLFQSGLTDIRD
jgi:hypothetical protein